MTPRARSLAAALLALVTLGTAACGDSETTPGREGSEPITDRGVAALAIDHLGREPLWVGPHQRRTPQGAVGATMKYDGTWGARLDLLLKPEAGDGEPCPASDDGCETLEVYEPGEWSLGWQLTEDGDTGHVTVHRRIDGEEHHVRLSGPEITTHPSSMDLEFGVGRMTAVLRDDRLGLETDPSVNAEGEALRRWRGEPPNFL